MREARLRFGIRPHGWIADPTPFADIVRWVARAEALGFDSVHVADRLLSRVPPVYESTMYEVTACLATFAAHTKSMQLSPLVYNAPYRHPVLTAKVFASLDVVSQGRIVLAVGGGWNAHEFETLGIPRERRGRYLEESVEVIRRLWTENHVDHDGVCFSFRDVSVEPKPVQRPHPPIWFGSIGPEAHEFTPLVERVLDRIARLGDGWAPLTYSTHAKTMTDPGLLGRAWRRIEEGMQGAGRDPRRFEIIYSHWCYVTTGEAGERERCEEAVRRWFDGTLDEARRTYLVGGPDEIADRIAASAADLPRIDRFIFTPFSYDREQMDRLAEAVLPRLRERFSPTPGR